jgi:hypothetical protein
MRSVQGHVEFGYQLSIRSGTKENHGKLHPPPNGSVSLSLSRQESNMWWFAAVCRESGPDAPHVVVQHGLLGLAVPVPQRHRWTHPRLYGEYLASASLPACRRDIRFCEGAVSTTLVEGHTVSVID